MYNNIRPKIERKKAIRYLIRIFGSLLAQIIIFFSLSSWHMPRAWFFFIIIFVYYIISTIILFKTSPDLINERGGPAFKEDSKKWDKYLLLIYSILGIYGQVFVAGLDLGILHWWYLGLNYLSIGLILFLISDILIIWSMTQNPFFEPSVRIQDDRDQKVISSGPYHFIRHPGYLSGILWHISLPLILGSGLALIYSIIIIAILVIRTYLEDATLQKELTGYSEYTKKTKYRLFPFIW